MYLPQSLREEIDKSVVDSPRRTMRNSKPYVSRKDARMEKRINRKNKPQNFPTSTPHSERRPEGHIRFPKRQKTRHDTIASYDNSHPKPRSTMPYMSYPVQSTKTFKAKNESTKLEKLVRDLPSTRPYSSRTQGEEGEDSYIAYLESKLGYAKGEKRAKAIERDDLDDLLDFTKTLANPRTQNEEISEMSREDFGDGDKEDAVTSGNLGDEGDEWQGIDEEIIENMEGLQAGHLTPEKQGSNNRYVTPSLRHAQREDDKSSEIMVKLSKQLKGLLNRMSEQNLSTILDNVEQIYRDHAGIDVTAVLAHLIIDGIVSHSSLMDSYIVLHAAFVSSMHKIIGIEFVANFVQSVISLYEQHYALLQGKSQTFSDGDLQGKECSNLIVLLSELYNFQVISSNLVFDVIRSLLSDDLTEYGVELLLKIVRNAGQQLRQDDPLALKEIVRIVQSKMPGNDNALSSRTRFMIETLTNLRNNKLKRNVTQNQGADTVERMKKILAGLPKRRHVLTHEPLRISLEDFRSAGTKGKWWHVGAAGASGPLIDQRTNAVEKAETTHLTGDLYNLAREQGMNTDIRRSIFVVLMSSDDYVDACERLSQLNLTEIQQREIVRVILHCCGNERSYNPYYPLICQHLCRSSHSHKITLQFCLWDFLRDLGETSVGGVELIKSLKDGNKNSPDVRRISTVKLRNVAKAYAWWIARDCITLAILNPVDFTDLKTQTRIFLRELLLHIFMDSQISTPTIMLNSKDVLITRNRAALEEIFFKATRVQNLAMGLVYFISEVFRDLSNEEEDLTKLIKWASGLAIDTLRAGIDTIPNI